MLKVAGMEIGKIFRSKNFLRLMVFLALIMSITILISYSAQIDDQVKPNLIHIIYDIFNANGKVFFPIVVTIYFASIIINEFKYKTIKLQFSSTKCREEIYIGQFLGASVVFFIIFIGLLI